MAVRGEHEAHSYEPFTRHRCYEAVNRTLVEEGVRRLAVPAARAVTVVDLSRATQQIIGEGHRLLRQPGTLGSGPSSISRRRSCTALANDALGAGCSSASNDENSPAMYC